MASYKAMLAQPEAWQAKRHPDGMPRFGRPMQLALQPFIKVASSQKLICCSPTASFE
jgi:hypothetical protein